MKTKPLRLLPLLVAVFCLSFTLLHAQEDPIQVKCRIETRDGNRYVGVFSKQDTAAVYLITESAGEIRIPKIQILDMEFVNAEKRPEDTSDSYSGNARYSTYFVQNSGYGLKKGEWVYQNRFVYLNDFEAGLSDRFSIGFGFTPFFFASGGDGSFPIYLRANYGLPLEENQLHWNASAFYLDLLGDDAGGGAFITTGLTFGRKDSHLGVSLGYGVADGEVSRTPTLSLNGLTEVSTRTSLIAESFFFTSDDSLSGLAVLGARSATGQRLATTIDYGILIIFADGAVGVPYLGLRVPLSHKKF